MLGRRTQSERHRTINLFCLPLWFEDNLFLVWKCLRFLVRATNKFWREPKLKSVLFRSQWSKTERTVAGAAAQLPISLQPLQSIAKRSGSHRDESANFGQSKASRRVKCESVPSWDEVFGGAHWNGQQSANEWKCEFRSQTIKTEIELISIWWKRFLLFVFECVFTLQHSEQRRTVGLGNGHANCK